MILDCPKCGAAHSKPEREVRNGTTISCRHCNAEFAMTGTGKVVLAAPAEANEPAPAAAAVPSPAGPSAFHVAPTDVVSVSAKVKAAAEQSTRAPASVAPAAAATKQSSLSPARVVPAAAAAKQSSGASASVAPAAAAAKQSSRASISVAPFASAARQGGLASANVAPLASAAEAAAKESSLALTDVAPVPAAVEAAAKASTQAPAGTGLDYAKTVPMTTSEIEAKLAAAHKASAAFEATEGAAAVGGQLVPADSSDESLERTLSEVARPAGLEETREEPSSDSASAEAASRAEIEASPGFAGGQETPSSAPELGEIDANDADPRSSGKGADSVLAAGTNNDELGEPFDDERPAAPSSSAFDASARLSTGTGPPLSAAGAVATYSRAIARWFMAAPGPVKAVSSSVVLVATLLAAIGIVALTRGEQELFTDETAALMSGPGAQPPYTKVADLSRGTKLIAFADGSIGDWVMVRDVMGRAGFVNATSLSDFRPASLPGLAFAACSQSPIEDGIKACQTRAQEQLDSCRSTCDGDDDPATCSDHCQQRFVDCVRGCEGAAAELVDLPVASPTLDDASPKLRTGAAGSVTPQQAKKKTRTKVRRKKKRRR